MIEELDQEIRKNKKIWTIYVAYQLLQEYAAEYNLSNVLMTLEDVILNELGYYEDFESHKLKKLKEKKWRNK